VLAEREMGRREEGRGKKEERSTKLPSSHGVWPGRVFREELGETSISAPTTLYIGSSIFSCGLFCATLRCNLFKCL
jgi:hypothetical protein